MQIITNKDVLGFLYQVLVISAHSHAHKEVEKSVEAAKDGHVSSSHSHEGHEHGYVELHSFIGIALVLGFVFMLLVDQLSGGTTHVHAPSGMYHMFTCP